MLETNKIYCMDCVEGMKLLDDGSVDLVVTSPPYDNLREYKGFSWDFESVAFQLFRVIKDGGVVVWVVGDATIKGSETGTSFRQALKFMDIGFRLHDTMIYEKNSSTYPSSSKSVRYSQIFEFMFIFSKKKPKSIHLIVDKQNKWEGYRDFSKKLKNPVPRFSPRTNIWRYVTSFNVKTHHPAPFPSGLAEDHIISWSNVGDLVLDPFMGSGTTARMAKKNKRDYIGFDVSQEYCDIANSLVKEQEIT